MDKDSKVDIIKKLLENKVFDTMNESMNQVKFAKLLGYNTRSSLQRVLENKAGSKAVDELWNRLCSLDVVGNGMYLRYLAKLNDDYETLIDVLKTDQVVFDWVAEYWLNETMPAIKSKILLSFPKEKYYIEMLLAYSFYRQNPEKYKSLKLGELKVLFVERLSRNYTALNMDALKQTKTENDNLDFSIFYYLIYIGISITALKPKKVEQDIVRCFDGDTYWVDLLSNPEDANLEDFFILKEYTEGAYFYVKVVIKDPQKINFDFLGVVAFCKFNGISLFGIDDGANNDVYIMFMEQDKMTLQTEDGKLFQKLKKIDINGNENVINIHSDGWKNKILETVISHEFKDKIELGLLAWFKKKGFEFPANYKILNCIKTSEYLFYQIRNINDKYWIKFELGVYPELDIIQPNDNSEIIKTEETYMMTWFDANLHLSIDKLDKYTDAEIIEFLGLKK